MVSISERKRLVALEGCAAIIIEAAAKQDKILTNVRLQNILFLAIAEYAIKTKDFSHIGCFEEWSNGFCVPSIYEAYSHSNVISISKPKAKHIRCKSKIPSKLETSFVESVNFWLQEKPDTVYNENVAALSYADFIECETNYRPPKSKRNIMRFNSYEFAFLPKN